MSYQVQINMKGRKLTPEQGQAILKEMHDQVPVGASSDGSWKILETKNNVKGVEWPQWLIDWIRQLPQIEYDSINWIFYRHYKLRSEADAVHKWLADLREWARVNDPEKFAVLEQIEVKIHDAAGTGSEAGDVL